MAEAKDNASEEAQSGTVEPWFAKRDSTTLLLYRVNRRPMSAPSLFAIQPEDVLDHISEVLLFGEVVETGRSNKREWILGNRDIDLSTRTLSGQIGYERPTERSADHYDEGTKEWRDVVDVVEQTARAPFVFHADSRILGVLQHPTFSERTIPNVFTALLNRGEDARESRSTEWDVEPILDEIEFLEWLRHAESVEQVSFVAKLPNPSGLPEFEPVWSRLHEREAKSIREIMEARDPDRGLQRIEEDELARAYIAMASQGFGYVKGRRKRDNRQETYDQRSQVKRHIFNELPKSWTELKLLIIDYLLRSIDPPTDGNNEE